MYMYIHNTLYTYVNVTYTYVYIYSAANLFFLCSHKSERGEIEIDNSNTFKTQDVRQYLYFCTNNARKSREERSKSTTATPSRRKMCVSSCTFVLVMHVNREERATNSFLPTRHDYIQHRLHIHIYTHIYHILSIYKSIIYPIYISVHHISIYLSIFVYVYVYIYIYIYIYIPSSRPATTTFNTASSLSLHHSIPRTRVPPRA
jgi:hypothetical protein